MFHAANTQSASGDRRTSANAPSFLAIPDCRSSLAFLRTYRGLFLVLLLWVVILVPRWWCAAHAVAPARDAIRYWVGADFLLLMPTGDAVRAMDAPPLYPLWLAGLKGCGLAQTPELWWRSSQASNVLFYAVFLTGAYLIAVPRFGTTAAWWGCAFVSLLPRQIRYSADVLSDSLHAALMMIVLGIVMWGSRRPGLRSWMAAGEGGVVLAAAYLVRAEALVLLLAILVASGVSWGIGRGGSLRPMYGLALLAPVVVVMAGYASVRGDLAPKNTTRALVGGPTLSERVALEDASEESAYKTPVDAWMPAGNGPLVVAGQLSVSSLRVVWELLQETRVLLGLAGLCGLILWLRRSLTSALSSPIFWWIVGVLALAVLCRWRAGFVAGRYLMPILPWLGVLGVWGVERICERLAEIGWWFGDARRLARGLVAGGAALALVLSVPAWTEPLHSTRTAHRLAADWLRANTPPGEPIFDPTWMSAYFSGRPMMIPTPGVASPARYAVLDTSLFASAPANLIPALQWARSGTVVAEFPARRSESLQIVRLPAERGAAN